MNIADVEPVLIHLLVWQQAISWQRGPAPAFAAAHHLPETRALEEKDGVVGVGEVGSINVAIWMVSAHHWRENISDVFGEASCQAVGPHVESIHLFEQIIVFPLIEKSVQLQHGNKSQRTSSSCVCMNTSPYNAEKQ